MSITVGPLGTKLWQGLAADTKPAASDPRLKLNDVFFEKDTYKWYVWDGTAWNATGTVAPTPVPPMI